MTAWPSTRAATLSSKETPALVATVSQSYAFDLCSTNPYLPSNLQGSISTGANVKGVTITGNTIKNSDNAIRIKTKADATSASVSGVTYSGNTASNIKRFGVIIDQSYPSTLGTPGTGAKISVRFPPAPTLQCTNSTL